MRRLVVCVVVAALGLAWSGSASANGRFPRSVKLLARPGAPHEMALGMTFGLLVTKDDGASWRWICESAVGFSGTFDPDYELSRTGAIFATTFRGMNVTRDGCQWAQMPEPLGARFVSSVAIGPDDAIYAGLADPDNSRIYKSTDDGLSFQPTGPLGMPGDWWMTIEVAPGDPQRIYVTGFRAVGGGPRQKIMFRSSDGGASWVELSTAMLLGTDSSDLQLAAISPTDAGRVIMRVTLTGPALQETLYLSENAGGPAGQVTWAKVLEVPDNIPGVAFRPDGSLWAATPFRGLHRSTDGGRTFAVVPDVTYEGRCLLQREDGQLFLCGNELPPDSRSLTSSPTGLAGTWIPRLRFGEIAGPVDCPAGTLQKDECEGLLWCGLREQLGITTEVIDCADEVDAGIDGASVEPPDKSCCDTGGGPTAIAFGHVANAQLPWRAPRRRARARARA